MSNYKKLFEDEKLWEKFYREKVGAKGWSRRMKQKGKGFYTTRKGRVDKATSQLEFDNGNGKGGKYEVVAIYGSAVYAKESEGGHLPGFYYLVSWKGYPKENNT